MSIENTVNYQRILYNSKITRPLAFRLYALKSLKEAIIKNESKILAALQKDLQKSSFEGYMTEVGMVLDELSYVINNLSKWARVKGVRTPIAHFSAKSFIMPEPYGVILIMSPWNYPFQLALTPLIGAIAAGNCCVLKPSAYAPATSQVVCDLLKQVFDQQHVSVVQGGRQENQSLLEQKFDYIFFTGSIAVGKIVMKAAAENLTPVTLELGGKSPCIVDKTANLKLAAKRLVFGKLLNAGQTCVAPDYLLVHEDIKDKLLENIKACVNEFLGKEPLLNPDYPKTINERHFQRLIALMEHETIIMGGKSDPQTLKIELTLLDNCTFASKIMQEEIFGPIFPIITFRNHEKMIRDINSGAKPLALYLFAQDTKLENMVLTGIAFGGGCINDTIIHLANTRLPFGGVGESGMGGYHGKKSFDTFTHYKSIIKRSYSVDLDMRYHPYTEKKFASIRKFLK